MDKLNKEIKFKEETNTFILEVIYTENKVILTLKDYIDWVIYCRIYTEEDIGK
jgi:hypothetical protein